jgi:hypothetical protein
MNDMMKLIRRCGGVAVPARRPAEPKVAKEDRYD